MSGPFKMKYTGSQKSDFPFKGTPLTMYGGMKDSPMRSWWSKVKEKVAGVAAKGKGLLGGVFGGGSGEVEGGGMNVSTVPQHGPEAHSGGERPQNPFGRGIANMLRASGMRAGQQGGGGLEGDVNNQNPMGGLLAKLFGGGGGLI